MPNALYNSGKQALLRAEINLQTATITAALVSTSYTVNLSGHANLTSISANIVGTPQNLANKTTTAGVFDADDVMFPAVASGPTVRAAVLYLNTGTPSTSTLLAYIDQITGFPLATNGGDITIQWDNGAFKIFSL